MSSSALTVLCLHARCTLSIPVHSCIHNIATTHKVGHNHWQLLKTCTASQQTGSGNNKKSIWTSGIFMKRCCFVRVLQTCRDARGGAWLTAFTLNHGEDLCFMIHCLSKTSLRLRHTLSRQPLRLRHTLSRQPLRLRHTLSRQPLRLRHTMSRQPLRLRHTLSRQPLRLRHTLSRQLHETSGKTE
jgi:hypothetical protein